MAQVDFILTGGTIDALTVGQERDIIREESSIPPYLRYLNLGFQINFKQICKKDSRDVSVADRLKILEEIVKSSSEIFVVTHGTFTMVETAKFLKNNLKHSNKKIVLTGSMVPLGFPDSDAPFNLGFVLGKLDSLTKGVFVLMNGRVFDPEEAVKDLKSNLFYSLTDK